MTSSTRRKAASTRLEPGQHSIERNTPRKRPNGGPYVLDWSVRLWSGALVEKRSQAATAGEVRARARRTAEELLATGGGGAWRSTTKTREYVEAVSRPLIADGSLRPNSKTRYLFALDLLLGDCQAHKHTAGLGELPLADASRFRALEKCLQEIARSHGSETARQARGVASKYILGQLVRDDLVQGNPLHGVDIDLSGGRPRGRARGGRALSREEYAAVMGRLFALDPAEGVEAPKRGRWSLEDRVAKQAAVVDLTLLQMSTGLRLSEALGVTWADASDHGGQMSLTVSAELSKTHRARTVPVLAGAVADRLRERRDAAGGAGHVIAAPAGGGGAWDRANASKAVAALYQELAEQLGIELLRTARTHVWRVTLNSLLLGMVPEVQRAAYFGHDAAVNRSAYTDVTDTSEMVAAARALTGTTGDTTVY
ncbi:site-specific integrase [Micrococcus luteus]|nr:site-specific integrase [Micrococcus luteus]